MTSKYPLWFFIKFTFLIFLFSPFFTISQTPCSSSNGSIVVTNTLDQGPGSLRDAITCANLTPGINVINFNIPGNGPHVIYVGALTGAPLPVITDAGTIIDASTQPGFANGNGVVLDGSQTIWGGPFDAILINNANSCAVLGLTIRFFPDDAIDVTNSDNCVIGGPGVGNIIYSNGSAQNIFPGFPGSWLGCGIVLKDGSDNCSVEGNIVGTDFSQTLVGGNEFCGVIVLGFSLNNQIQNNVIANHPQGVRIDNAFNNTIRFNEMYCNSSQGILFTTSGNNNKPAPTIVSSTTTQISGTGPTGDIVDVYLMDDTNCSGVPCQGRIYLGSTTVSLGTWDLIGPFVGGFTPSSGQQITAISTSSNGTSSPFSNCAVLLPGSNTNTCASANGVIMVTNTNDSGIGSLRSAIECANATQGPNQIFFNIPGQGPHQIFVGSGTGIELPPLLDAGTILDATTQPGFGVGGNYTPKIVLNGSQNNWQAPIDALLVLGNSCEVYGFEIINFPDDGIDVTGGDFCVIGGPNKGNVLYNNGSPIDFFPGAPGTGPWNGCGIVMKDGASNTLVQGNIVGTNLAQTINTGNEYCGIIVQSNCFQNIIGGSGVGEANIIAFNEVGVRISNTSFGCRIQQNYMYCNSIVGIQLLGNGNQFQAAPTIINASASVITGVAAPNDFIEVFANDDTLCPGTPCQGGPFLGTVQADANGVWSLAAPFANSLTNVNDVVATATDFNSNTSPFSNCFSLSNCGSFTSSTFVAANASCGLSNGAVISQPNGGTAPFFYNIGNGVQNNGNFVNLGAGNYQVTITDASGCSSVTPVTVDTQPGFTASIQNISDESCNSQNGSFTVSTAGIGTSFTYDIGNGSVTSPTFTNLSAGTYMVTVTDINGCTNTQTAFINSVNVVLNAPTVQNANCGASDGSITFSANGTTPYNFDLGNGNVANNVFSNLTAGTYTVTVTDGNGCTDSQTVTLSGGNPPTASFANIQDETCGQSNGSFAVNIAGGTTPYSFDIGAGSVTSGSFANLNAGNYNVTVSDSNGCTDVQTVTINNSSAPTFAVFNIVDADCGQFNGGFTITPNGGVAPYTYDDGSGATSNPQFSNIGVGAYNIIVTDANGCTASQVVTINQVDLDVNIQSIADANCGVNNGSVTIGTIAGTAPFSYDVGNGVTSNNIISNLSGGNYTVTVSDNNGCTGTESFTINTTSAVTFTVSNIVDATCGQQNGSFTINPSGGTAPYTYNDGSGPTSNPQFSGVTTGAYNVLVIDFNGCTFSQVVTVNSIGLTVNVQSSTMANCGMNDGSVTIGTTGGTAPFTYDVGNGVTSNNTISNLSGGNYTVTVTDNNGCTETETFSINSTSSVTATVSNIVNAGCGQQNGGFTINASGGATPYTYDDGSGSTSNNVFSNLNAGSYSVLVTDANGCTTTENVTIANAGTLTVSIANIANTTCGQTNGSFTVNPSGTAPYTYDIGNGNISNNVFSNLSSGNYSITITDATGCSITESVTINDVGGPQIISGDIVPADCGQANGAISITTNGGTPGYTYDVGNGPLNNNVISGLLAGSYDVTVTDANGCADVITVTVNDMGSVPTAGFLYTNSTLTVSFSNTSSNVNSYFWDFGDGNTSTLISPTHVFSSAGTYNTCLTVTNNCGTDTRCESITLVGTGSSPLVVEVGLLTGVVGDIVQIPVTVQNFEDIVSFQKSIAITDTTVAEFVGVSNLNLVDLNVGSFNISPDVITMNWLDASGNGQTVTPNTVIYTIDVLVKGNISCSNIVIGSAPTPIQVVKKINGNNVTIGSQMIDGEICAIGSTNSPVDIGGEIAKENGQPVANVDVSCTTANNFMTTSSGLYHFPSMTHGNTYTITPFKNDVPTNGVTGLDMVLIQQHILGTAFLNSPYKMIAADANKSGTITTIDLAVIQGVILGNILEFPNNTSWRFIPESFVFTDSTNPFLDNFPESITLNNLIQDELNEDFVAVKVGDVNLNASPSLTANPSQDLTFMLGQSTIVEDGFVQIDFKSKNHNNVSAWQLDLSFDVGKMDFETIEKGALPGFSWSNTGERFLEEGILPIVWINPSGGSEGLTLEDGTILFSLKFRLKSNAQFSKEWLGIETSRIQKTAFRDTRPYNINLAFEEIIPVSQSSWEVSDFYPNPFDETTAIEFILPQNEKVQFQVFEVSGKMIYQKEWTELPAGKNKIELSGIFLQSSGVYYYRLRTSQNHAEGKIIYTK